MLPTSDSYIACPEGVRVSGACPTGNNTKKSGHLIKCGTRVQSMSVSEECTASSTWVKCDKFISYRKMDTIPFLDVLFCLQFFLESVLLCLLV